MTVKLRIRLGTAEIDYEGPEDFLKAELQTILGEVSALRESLGSSNTDLPSGNGSPSPSTLETPNTKSDIQLSTNTIATKLGGGSAANMVIAACAYLTFVRNKDTFSRAEILDEMKAARHHYNKNHGSNLSATLKSLMGQDKLNQLSGQTYALAQTERERLELLLANK